MKPQKLVELTKKITELLLGKQKWFDSEKKEK
jgi:hypothetical protein